MTISPTVKGSVSLGLSIAALLVSVYAAVQSRRDADANERLASLTEEQMRPRLSIHDVSATLGPDWISISFSVTNVGTLPGTITAARVNTLTLADGTQLGHDVSDLERSVVYPGKSVVGTVSGARRFSPAGTSGVDMEAVKANSLEFALAYQLHGRPNFKFSESARFPSLEWRKQ